MCIVTLLALKGEQQMFCFELLGRNPLRKLKELEEMSGLCPDESLPLGDENSL